MSKEFTIEELEKQYKELGEMLTLKKQEEAEKKQAKLAAEKDARKAEVDLAFDHWVELYKAYKKDYGSYTLTRNNIDEFPWAWFWN